MLDAQGRSRAHINGRPATLAQLEAIGELLIDLHGQHAHQSLGRPETQRRLLDAYGGFAALAREVALAWRAWQDAVEHANRGMQDAAAIQAERDMLTGRHAELTALSPSVAEWERLAHAATLLESVTAAETELRDGDAALGSRLAAVVQRLKLAAAHDAALNDVVALCDEARIRTDEAARALRSYRERLDLDPGELERVETRLTAFHDAARKYRVRPGELPKLAEETIARLAVLAAGADAERLGNAEADARRALLDLARELSAKRKLAAAELGHRVSAMMKRLAMAGGRVELALIPVSEPASFGLESAELQVATHAKQPLGPLARVASGGELSRLGLAIQVVLAEVGELPTLVFDEVDAGIGGAVAATVGRMLQQLGKRRQVLCVTHLPQVAACADHHHRVIKRSAAGEVATELTRLDSSGRVEELARMLGGHEVTAKTRAHAKELLAQHRTATPP
ncbi:MAG TPA: DNA repair protein RecN [Burkholderiaceae bacterium]